MKTLRANACGRAHIRLMTRIRYILAQTHVSLAFTFAFCVQGGERQEATSETSQVAHFSLESTRFEIAKVAQFVSCRHVEH